MQPRRAPVVVHHCSAAAFTGNKTPREGRTGNACFLAPISAYRVNVSGLYLTGFSSGRATRDCTLLVSSPTARENEEEFATSSDMAGDISKTSMTQIHLVHKIQRFYQLPGSNLPSISGTPSWSSETSGVKSNSLTPPPGLVWAGTPEPSQSRRSCLNSQRTERWGFFWGWLAALGNCCGAGKGTVLAVLHLQGRASHLTFALSECSCVRKAHRAHEPNRWLRCGQARTVPGGGLACL